VVARGRPHCSEGQGVSPAPQLLAQTTGELACPAAVALGTAGRSLGFALGAPSSTLCTPDRGQLVHSPLMFGVLSTLATVRSRESLIHQLHLSAPDVRKVGSLGRTSQWVRLDSLGRDHRFSFRWPPSLVS
jgi:hypothetical protein